MIHTNIWLNVVKFFHCLDPRNVDLCPPGYGTNLVRLFVQCDDLSENSRGRDGQEGKGQGGAERFGVGGGQG